MLVFRMMHQSYVILASWELVVLKAVLERVLALLGRVDIGRTYMTEYRCLAQTPSPRAYCIKCSYQKRLAVQSRCLLMKEGREKR